MPLINRIEVSNFMNATRRDPWQPTWPHQIFELMGLNSVINMPNGRGKTTIVTAILCCLAGLGRKISDIRSIHFAPKHTGRYTHLRVQMTMDTESGAAFDMFDNAPQGQQMVFGVYGRSGENETYSLYAYHGTFEDCPVHRESTEKRGHLELIADNDFVDRLQIMPGRFPTSARDKSLDAWRTYISKWFDMTGIEQQINYQLKAGGEGKSAYFEVKPRVGMRYSTAVFYEHLAPQLLTNVMGDYGEDDEYGIEDTIHEKACKVVHAKVFSELRRKQLVQTHRVLTELQRINEAAENITKADIELQTSQGALATELAVLRNIVIEKPVPGLPTRPQEDVPEVANYLVLCDGQPYMPDRAFEVLTGEDPRVINQRALRGLIHPSEVEKTQLLEIVCDQKKAERDERGRLNKFYDLEGSLHLLYCTDKYLPGCDMERAVVAVKAAFEWAAANADTNPARLQKNAIDQERSAKTAERDGLLATIVNLSKEKTALLEEQQQIGEQQAEYRLMQQSGLFTPEELEQPTKTATYVEKESNNALAGLTTHNQMVAKQELVFAEWEAFNVKHGDSSTPEGVLVALQEAEGYAKDEHDAINKQHDELSARTRPLKEVTEYARRKRDALAGRVKEAEQNSPAAKLFDELFPGESPEGLELQVVSKRNDASRKKTDIVNELAKLSSILIDLADFRLRFGENRDPGVWLTQRAMAYENAVARYQSTHGELKEAMTSLNNLKQFSIAPNNYVRTVTEKIGVPSTPLYQVVEQIGLPLVTKEAVLSLFSGLLNAPVLADVVQAAVAARNLADNGYEFPVFLHDDLVKFCRAEKISFNKDLARNLFVGVRTRAVECLLDPSLVEREKERMRQEIKRLQKRLVFLDKSKKRLAAGTDTANLASRASHAINTGAVERDAKLRVDLEAADSNLTRLERRASDAAREAIRGILLYRKALGGLSIEELVSSRNVAANVFTLAEADEQSNTDSIKELTNSLGKAAEALRVASVAKSQQEQMIRRIITFMADAEYGPVFMLDSARNRTICEDRLDKSNKRNAFRFELAQKFVVSGLNRPLEIESRLGEITAQIPKIESRKDALNAKIEELGNAHNKITPQVFKIDQMVQKLIKLYRKYRHRELPCETSAQRHGLFVKASFLRASTSDSELIAHLCSLGDEVDDFSDQLASYSLSMINAESAYTLASDRFNSDLIRIAQDQSLDMSAHLRHLLEQSKTDPARIKVILAATQDDYNKDKVANETASQQLDLEWENMAGWLSEFTHRLPTYFKLMKQVFAPQFDAQGGQVTHSGFVISGEVMQLDDVQAVMGDIVNDIEDYERNQRKSSDSDSRKESKKGFRREIRNKFYQRILSNPTIKVCIPSISEKPLALEKEMASSGQGVAISLLWIVKLADFVSERERQRKTVTGSRFDIRSSVSAKKLRNLDSQFVFIDGAFSHLSDPGLIKDALKGISRTHGRFQLIVTGHDPDYNFKHNFDYFPTLLTGREIGDRYMYVENGKPIEPVERGSNIGAMNMIRLHKIVDKPEDGTTND